MIAHLRRASCPRRTAPVPCEGRGHRNDARCLTLLARGGKRGVPVPFRTAPPAPLTTPPGPKPPRRPDHRHPDRVRADRTDTDGKLTLRVNGQLHHSGINHARGGTRVLMLVQDQDVRIINAATGEVLREFTIDPNRDYQPTGNPRHPVSHNQKVCGWSCSVSTSAEPLSRQCDRTSLQVL